jgi:small-conductance mechanosensitive channel
MNFSFQELLRVASELFTTPILKVGETVISLSSLFQLVLSILVVVVFSRVLKNFLKQQLLVKLRIAEGNREEIATIISYGAGIIAFIIVLQSTNFNLASLAVLAGGLGVGIGFGLQDATKNFISDLTILLERKLKVGDFIEFDSLSGYIKEISIRSTLIHTREGGDVVVPNSKLVETLLINWSYDSFIARIHIPVRVASESNTALVTETLLKSAYMETAVLQEPPPEVIFVDFGDKSLNFELRVWVNRIDREPQIKSALNFIIEYNLRQQQISIAFPQMELLLRNQDGLIQNSQLRVNPLNFQPLCEPLTLPNLLRKVTYFQNFTDLEIHKLVEVGYRKRLSASEVLFHEDERGDTFYIILSGSIEVFVIKLNKSLSTLQAGQFFGELSLMLGIPRTATVRALEDTVVFVINSKGFKKLLQEHPNLSERIIQELEKNQE